MHAHIQQFRVAKYNIKVKHLFAGFIASVIPYNHIYLAIANNPLPSTEVQESILQAQHFSPACHRLRNRPVLSADFKFQGLLSSLNSGYK